MRKKKTPQVVPQKTVKTVSSKLLCPHCKEKVSSMADICPVCGEKIEKETPSLIAEESSVSESDSESVEEGVSYDSECVIKKESSAPIVVIAVLAIVAFIITLAVFGLGIKWIFSNYNSSKVVDSSVEEVIDESETVNEDEYDPNDLYSVESGNNIIFVDQKGKIVLDLGSEYDFVGEFSEGKIVAAKQIRIHECESMFDEYIAHVSILDTKGNVIKELPFEAVVTPEWQFPKFRNSYVYFELEDGKVIKVDSDGNEIAKLDSIPDYDVNSGVKEDFYHSREYVIDKNAPVPFVYGDEDDAQYVGYKDKKGNLIKLDTYNPYGTDDMSCDVHFYNGVALVFVGDGNRRFINTHGEFINNETYDYALPFWRKLAYVSKGDKWGLINTKGEWVWSNK